MIVQTPIRGLRSFCYAAKNLSFKLAANQLYITPSAVSHQIKLLEEYLGFELFVRKTRAIELTSEGELFFQAISPKLTEMAQTIECFKTKPHNKVIVIAMPEFFASELFVPKLKLWTEANPNIDIQIESGKPGIQEGRSAQLSIVLTNTRPASGTVSKLFPIRYVPACNKQIFEQYSDIGIEVLQQQPLIVHKARPKAWHQWAENVGIEHFDPQQVIVLDSMFAVSRAAQQGMGIALVPLPIANGWFETGLLVKLFDQQLHGKDSYFLVSHNNDSDDKSLIEFAKWVKKQFAGLT